jgi:Asp-tRNA(Asn)/Glu-tRNA(Gln) amidotransferase A subunit family amidase
MGKTVTTEFAYFAPGPSRNPYNLDHTPGGSSSGSAAAVAAKLCPVATGSQTIGSINRPAAFCGVVGLKPTYDRIPRDGVIPLSPSLDHIGLFTSDIRSMQLVASVICSDWQKSSGSNQPVLGVIKGPYLEHVAADGIEQFWDVCRTLEEAGYQIRHVNALSHMKEVVKRHFLILASEAAQVHAHWFSEFSDLYHERTTHLIKLGRQKTIEEVTLALTSRQELRAQLSQLMKDEGIDLWVSPAAPGVAPKGLHSTGDPVMNLPWTHCGFPSLTVPSGFDEEGLPFGLQLASRWGKDEELLNWSLPIEAALNSIS